MKSDEIPADIFKNPNNGRIGTYGERTLHAVLKNYYEPDQSRHEQPFMGYIADICNEKGVTEIQTRNFNTMRKKLGTFLEKTPVTIVYPAVRRKWLLWIDPETGEITPKRRSPKTGTPYIVFNELYRIKSMLCHANLHLKILMVDLEEYRQLNGWSRDKKHGATRSERIPVGFGDEIDIYDKSDYIKLVPENLPSVFYAEDFGKNAHISRSCAQTALNILNFTETVERIGRDKKGFAYKIKKAGEQ